MQATGAHVAATVRAEAARRKLSQQSLAAAAGITTATLSRRLAGASPFTVPELLSLAAVLDVPVALLLGEPVSGAA